MIENDLYVLNELVKCVAIAPPNFGQLVDILFDLYVEDELKLEQICRQVDARNNTALHYAIKQSSTATQMTDIWSSIISLLIVCGADRQHAQAQSKNTYLTKYAGEIERCVGLTDNEYFATTLSDQQRQKFKKLFVERYFIVRSPDRNFNPFFCMYLIAEEEIEKKLLYYFDYSYITQCVEKLVADGFHDKKQLMLKANNQFRFEDIALTAWFLIGLRTSSRVNKKFLGEPLHKLFVYYFEQCNLQKKFIYANLVTLPVQNRLFKSVISHPDFEPFNEYKRFFEASTKTSIQKISPAAPDSDQADLLHLFSYVRCESLDLPSFVNFVHARLPSLNKNMEPLLGVVDSSGLTAFAYVANTVAKSTFYTDKEMLDKADVCAIFSAVLYGCGARLIKKTDEEGEIYIDPFFTRQCLLFLVQVASQSSEFMKVSKQYDQQLNKKLREIIDGIANEHAMHSPVAKLLRSYITSSKFKKELFTQHEYQDFVFWYIMCTYAKNSHGVKSSVPKSHVALYQWLMTDESGERSKFATCLKLFFPHSKLYCTLLESDPLISNIIHYDQYLVDSERALAALLEETSQPVDQGGAQSSLEKIKKTRKRKPKKSHGHIETIAESEAPVEIQSPPSPPLPVSSLVVEKECAPLIRRVTFDYVQNELSTLLLTHLSFEKLNGFSILLRHCARLAKGQSTLVRRIGSFLQEIEFSMDPDQKFSYHTPSEEVDYQLWLNRSIVSFVHSISSEINPQGAGRLQVFTKKYANSLIKLINSKAEQHQQIIEAVDPIIALLPAIDIPNQLYIVGSLCSYLLENAVMPDSSLVKTRGDIDLALVVTLDQAEFANFFSYLVAVFAMNVEPYSLYFSRLFDRTDDGRLFCSLKFQGPEQQVDLTVYCEKDLVLHTRKVDSLKSISYNVQQQVFQLTRDHLLLFLNRKRAFSATAFDKPFTLAYVLRELAKSDLMSLYQLTDETQQLIKTLNSDPSSRPCLRQAIGLCLVKYVYSLNSALFQFLKSEGYLAYLGHQFVVSSTVEHTCETILVRLRNSEEKEQNWLPLVYFTMVLRQDPLLLASTDGSFNFLPKRIQHQIAWVAPQLGADNLEDSCVTLVEHLRYEQSYLGSGLFRAVQHPVQRIEPTNGCGRAIQ